MGLLRRARSVQEASRSDRLTAGGLLQKGLNLIEKLAHGMPAVGQTELEASPLTAIPETPAGRVSESTESSQPGPEAEEAVPPEREELTDEQRRVRLWAGLRELEPGIESPARMFSLIKELLELDRAAILLYDPVRMAFAPWAVCGFDETTKHRLRIPLRTNETMNRLASGKVFLLSSPEELQPFHPFFSTREFSTLGNLLLVPFVHESKFMGMLLAANPRHTDPRTLEVLGERAARHTYASRERHLEGVKRSTPPRPESIRETVRAAVKPCLGRELPPLMILITTGDLTDSIRKRNSHIDTHYLSQDISRVVLSLFQSIGSVYQVDAERLLIVVSNLSQPLQEGDAGLLLHHMKATLARFLPELAGEEPLRLDEQVRVPSPDIEEVLTQLAEIV